jgi:hypothetical protein
MAMEQAAATMAATAVRRTTALCDRAAAGIVATATMATVTTEQATTVAAAVIDRATASGNASTTMAGNRHFLTADQGDADNRAKNRDAKDQRTIHPRILHKRYRNVRVQQKQDPTKHSAVLRSPPSS